MTDREKVVSIFDGLRQFTDTDIHPIVCPDHWLAYSNLRDVIDVAEEDILELLKEQEAVEPIPPTDESDLWKCGNCNHQLFRCTHQRYCDMCGKKVKWE